MTTPGYQRSRDVLRALIQGNDLDTGEELDKDTVLNRGDVIRALIAALGALEKARAAHNSPKASARYGARMRNGV